MSEGSDFLIQRYEALRGTFAYNLNSAVGSEFLWLGSWGEAGVSFVQAGAGLSFSGRVGVALSSADLDRWNHPFPLGLIQFQFCLTGSRETPILLENLSFDLEQED